MLEKGGSEEQVSITRVRCAWGEFNEFTPIFTMRRAFLKLTGKFYKARIFWCIESCSIDLNDLRRLERVENTMLRGMCGVALRDRKCSTELTGLGLRGDKVT